MDAIKKWLDRFRPKSGFARNASLLALGTGLGQATAILVSPILTRLFTPGDFGQLQVYLSYMGFATILVTWRYEIAIFLPPDEESALYLTLLSAGLSLAMSLVFGIVILALEGLHHLPRELVPFGKYVWLMPISLFGWGMYQSLSSFALRKKAYKQVAVTKLTQTLSQVATQILLGFSFHAGAPGLLVSDAVGRINGSGALFKNVWRDHRVFFKQHVKWQKLKEVAFRYRHFPAISTGSALINTAGYALPALLLSRFYGMQVLGWFSLVLRVTEAPTNLIGQAVSQVYMSESAKLAFEEPEALLGLFRRTLQKLATWGAIPCLLVVVTAPSLFSLFFGPSWHEAGFYAQLMILMSFASFVVWPLQPTLNLLERQPLQLAWDIGRAILTNGGLLFSHFMGLGPRSAIEIYAITMGFCYFCHLILCYGSIKQRIRAKNELRGT